MQRTFNENTEKLTINVNHVDLGKIDLLVENGFFTNRTDFIRSAIRESLDKHDVYVKSYIEKNTFVIGVVNVSKHRLEEHAKKGEILNISVVGLLVIESNVSLALFSSVVKSISVKGTMIAPKEIKVAYEQKG